MNALIRSLFQENDQGQMLEAHFLLPLLSLLFEKVVFPFPSLPKKVSTYLPTYVPNFISCSQSVYQHHHFIHQPSPPPSKPKKGTDVEEKTRIKEETLVNTAI